MSGSARLKVESPCSIEAAVKGTCSFGAFSYIGKSSEMQRTDVGRYCSIARNVLIGPTSHPTDWFSTHLFVFTRGGAIAKSQEYQKILQPRRFAGHRQRTVIGNDVWIGANAVIRRGVKVGDGAIVGAGAVVVKDVQPYEIVGGVPARHIRFRFDDAMIARLLALQWWDYDLSSPALTGIDFSDVEAAVSRFESLLAAGSLPKLEPANELLQPEPPPEAVQDEAPAAPAPRRRSLRGGVRKLLRKLARMLD
ncbi:MAG: CatB-related O-acetyltransferase [Ramlibacter sp.]